MQSLLCAILCIISSESSDGSLYHLVLEHGDFGIHNTSITKDVNGQPLITSLYDWETACIASTLLSDPLVAAVPVDLIMDEAGGPSVTRLPKKLDRRWPWSIRNMGAVLHRGTGPTLPGYR